MYNASFAYGQQPQGGFAQPPQHASPPQYNGPPPPMQGYSAPFQQQSFPQRHYQQPLASLPTPSPSQQQSFINPALAVATDPNAFAQMFKGHLAALTFNSKPIITNLTIIAHEHSARMSNIIAQCLDEHILTCSPLYRLPAFYVVDSICKNVGAPYTALWADRIVPMFMETYRIVDHGVKQRMEELLTTWRSTGLGGRPLFGETAQYNIERSLYGNQVPPQQPQAPTPPFPGTTYNGTPQNIHQPISQPAQSGNTQVAAVVERFDRLLATSQHNQQQNPALFDGTRHEALTKLRALVASTQLASSDLGQIEAQLGSLEVEMLGQAAAASGAVRSPRLGGTPSMGYPQVRNTPPVGSALRSPRGATPIALPANLAGVLASIGKLGSGGATPPSAVRSPLPGLQALQGLAKPASGLPMDLIANLRKAGLLPSGSGTPERSIDADESYVQMIKGMSLKLTVSDLQRDPPLGSLNAVVAKELPLQCRQCANRYPAGLQGQASLDKHLDWHFRQNRRAKDSAVRGQSRSWFSRLDEWVRGGHDDTAPLRRAGDGEGTNGAGDGEGSGGIGSALTPQQEAELKEASKAFVLAPTDDPEASSRPCPVCKEMFKSEWSEDEEDFVWKNCVHVDGVYYHGSCHFSAKTLRTSVAGRNVAKSLKGSDSRSNSRDVTPQPELRSPRPAITHALTAIKEEQPGAKDQSAADVLTQTGVKRERDSEEAAIGTGEAGRAVTAPSTSDTDDAARSHKIARTEEA